MTEVSLSASIFGDKKDEKNTLSNLFTKVSDLPATPNNVNFLESTTERTKREKKEEKRKKRKNKYENEDEETNTSIDDKNKTLPEEPSVKKVKKRKVKSDDKKEEEDATGGDNQSEVIEESDEARTIFVGNLPLDITREKLKSIFKECGKIKSARLRSFSTTGVKVAPEHAGNQNLVKKVSVNTKQLSKDAPKKTSQGYVVFEEIESIDKALLMNNQPAPNSDTLLLRVDKAKPTLDSTRSVFMGNLPYKANEMTLRSHFNQGCGWEIEDDVIEGVRIVRDKETMQCKGFGYLLLKEKSYVPAALNMHESKYMKRDLRVMVCGKRFKNRKGAPKEGTQIVREGAHRRFVNRDKKGDDNKDTKSLVKSAKELIVGPKEKKKRGTKKIGVKKAGVGGISKRVASGKKVEKRVKKIQKRMEKGMGSSKK